VVGEAAWLRVGASYEIGVTADGQRLVHIGTRTDVWDLPVRRRLSSFREVANPSHLAVSHNGRLAAVKKTPRAPSPSST
jgi:hypothetical protein